jgi:pyruvate/2-oxoglutarate dehydrogenase complex dihydrolipoamide acyltransferase (E2) component
MGHTSAGNAAASVIGFVSLIGLVGALSARATGTEASNLAAAATTTSIPAGNAGVCVPVGDGTGTQVFVGLTEWRVEVDPASVPPGKTTFRVNNEGREVHELVVVKGDRPEALPVKDGAVDEDALPPGALIGEVEGLKSGGVCPGTFDLQPGQYLLFCNIVEKEKDGRLESHYERGMRTAFTVAAAAPAPEAAKRPSGAASPPAAPAPPAAGASVAPEPAPAVAGANALRTPQPAATSPETKPRTGAGSRDLLALAGLALAAGGLGIATGRPRRRAGGPGRVQPGSRLW